MCIFCKIANKEIPSYQIYEDDDFLAFLDLSQVTLGHTLVIPKVHTPNLLEVPEAVSNKIMIVVQKIMNQMSKNLGINNFNIMNNCGPLAGQTVYHFHIHILPRTENDGLAFDFKTHSYSSEEMKNIQKKILVRTEPKKLDNLK